MANKKNNEQDIYMDEANIFEENHTKKPKKKRKRPLLRIVFVVFMCALLFFTGVCVYIGWSLLNSMQREVISEGEIDKNIDDDGNVVDLKGYTNIALFGVDARNNTQILKNTHADTTMIISIDNKTGGIRLVSVYRDTYMNINDETDTYRKITEGYFFEGAVGAMNALNRNLDFDIEDFVSVNWSAVATAVNMLGGVEINVTEAELVYLNRYVNDIIKATGIASVELPNAGVHTLDGVQAVAYSRIRYVGMDFERTERQRRVITKMFEKVKKTNPAKLVSMLKEVLPQIATSFSESELLALIMKLPSYDIVYSEGFPFEHQSATIPNRNSCIIPQSHLNNVKQLHKTLFPSLEYNPSAKVTEIHHRINADAGITE